MSHFDEIMVVLNTRQNLAFKLVCDGHNVVVLGQAGTGKSSLIREMQSHLKSMGKSVSVVASTGIASTQFTNAKTLHSWGGLQDGHLSNDECLPKPTSHTVNVIKETDVLIAHEMSMTSAKVFEQFKPLGRVVKKGIKRKAPIDNKPRKKIVVEEDLSNCGSIHGTRRKSARIQGKPVGTEEEWRSVEEEDDEYKPKRIPANRPKFYGAVPGVEIGTVWNYRIDCSRDGIHRPTVAGIHRGEEGAYSVALSGGYDDNIDLGECFTYTGEGGRDLKGTASNPKNLRTAPQSKDQTLTNGNLALSKSCENGNPVRVIRGYKLDSPFAPEEGYRYDGIYTVEKFWFTTGLSGFGVWKFALRRCKDQAPPPWDVIQKEDSPKKNKTVSPTTDSAKGDNASENSPSHKRDENKDIENDEQNESSQIEEEMESTAEKEEVIELTEEKEKSKTSMQEKDTKETVQEKEHTMESSEEQETTENKEPSLKSTKEMADTLKSLNTEEKISQDENNNLGTAEDDAVKKAIPETSDSGIESDASGVESSQASSASV